MGSSPGINPGVSAHIVLMTTSEQMSSEVRLAAFEAYALAAGAQVSVVSDDEAAAAAIAGAVEGRVICTSAVKARYPGICAALESAARACNQGNITVSRPV